MHSLAVSLDGYVAGPDQSLDNPLGVGGTQLHDWPARPMQGGTTFHFVDDGIEAVLDLAFTAAGGADVRIGGGAAIGQQYLRAGLVDRLHLALVPVLLDAGARLFDDLDGIADGYAAVDFVSSPSVVHVRVTRTPG